MTLTTSTNVVTYDGDGSNTTFDFSFQLFSESDLTVIRTDAGGNETTVSTSDYNVSPASGTDYDNGGTVTYPTSGSPLPSGEKLTLIREVPYTQTTSLRNQSAYFPESVETAMDRLAAQIQQNNERLERAVKLPVAGSVELTFPAPDAGKVVGYNAAGTDLEAKTPNTSTYVSLPSTSVDNAFPRFDGTTGEVFQGGQTTEDDSGNVTIAGALTLGQALALAQGGTGASTASAARGNLGLGTAATKDTGTSSAQVPTNATVTSSVQDQAYIAADLSGTDTLTMSVSPAPSAYAEYQRFVGQAANNNTGAVTLNVNSLGAKTVKKITDSGKADLEADDIVANGVYAFTYDGTDVQLDGGVGGGDAFKDALLHVQDQKPSGTSGGSFNSGAWRTRDLNTVLTNEISGATLSSNQITLPAGTYYIEAAAPVATVNLHKAKLRNVTDSSDVLIGTNERADHSGVYAHQTKSSVVGRFTIGASKDFELQHRCATTRSSVGFGYSSGFGVIEVYTDVRIWKVG